jgi:hypothetical protein
MEKKSNLTCTGNMWVYDTLLGFMYHAFSDYYMYVFNVNPGKFLYLLCKCGVGPGEFSSIATTQQLVYDGQVYYWI